MKLWIGVAALVGVITLIGNWVGYHVPIWSSLIGMVFLLIVAILGTLLNKWIPKVSAVVWISLLGLLVTSSIFPFHNYIFQQTNKINFLALVTPALSYVGLSLGKDMESLKSLSWRVVVVSLVVFIGTFVISAVIAQFTLKFTGV